MALVFADLETGVAAVSGRFAAVAAALANASETATAIARIRSLLVI